MKPAPNPHEKQHVVGDTAQPMLLIAGWWLVTLLMWWLAFWSLPQASPDWLTRAQAVCFGSNASGLPSGYGWMVLIGSPLSLVVALWVVYYRELLSGLIGVYGNGFGKLVLLLVVLITSSEAAWVRTRIQEGMAVKNYEVTFETGEDLSETYPRTFDPAPQFHLKDQTGKVGGVQDFRGGPAILTFAFAHCKTMCPAILQEVRKAREKLPPSIPTLVVTLDPWRDTPSSLTSMAKSWELGENAFVYSGDPDLVSKAIRDYKVPTARDSATGDVTHPPMVYILDKEGRIAYTFNQPDHQWIVEAVARL